jgi:hypothetical protein
MGFRGPNFQGMAGVALRAGWDWAADAEVFLIFCHSFFIFNFLPL